MRARSRSCSLSTVLALLVIDLCADGVAAERLSYSWKSLDKDMTVEFVCEDGAMTVYVDDPERAAGDSYPVVVRTAVAYSPVLGAERDVRHVYRQQLRDGRVRMEGSEAFLADLYVLHRQSSDNREMVQAEYDKAVRNCGSEPTAERRDRCFEILPAGAYLSALGPVSITVDVVRRIGGLRQSGPAGIRVAAGFDSGELFRNLERLPVTGGKTVHDARRGSAARQGGVCPLAVFAACLVLAADAGARRSPSWLCLWTPGAAVVDGPVAASLLTRSGRRQWSDWLDRRLDWLPFDWRLLAPFFLLGGFAGIAFWAWALIFVVRPMV